MTDELAGPPVEARRPDRSRLLLILLAVTVVVVIGLSVTLGFVLFGSGDEPHQKTAPAAAASSASPTPSTMVTMRGTITMDQYEAPKDEFSIANWHKVGKIGCEGAGGYDDMTDGASVTVYGAEGQVVGVGSLNQGVWLGKQCSWVFEVGNLPEQQFYQVEVSHRGKISVPRSDVDQVSLSLG